LDVTPLIGRYCDAYALARVTVRFGSTIKFLGFLAAGILLLVAISAAGLSGALGVGGIVLAGLVGGIFYCFGVAVSALGQILLSTIDVAVNSSPFLENDQRAEIMSLH